VKAKSPTPLPPAATALFRDILNTGSGLRVKVTGKSMSPFLRDGDVVTIQKVPHASLGRGDVIFFRNGQGFPVLHRLIKKRRASNGVITFQTKGDALVSFDEPVAGHKVLGKVIKIEKKNSAGRIINMESLHWRTVNYLIALILLAKSTICYPVLVHVKRNIMRINPSQNKPI
jgi:signal peptidase I